MESGQAASCFRCSSYFRRGKINCEKFPKGTVFQNLLDEKDRKLSGDDWWSRIRKGGLCIAGVFGGSRFWRFRPTTFLFSSNRPIFLRIYSEKEQQFHGLQTDALFPALNVGPIQICSLCIEKGVFHFAKKSQEPKIGSWTNRLYPNPVEDFSIGSFLWAYHRLIGKENSHRRKSKKTFWKSLEIKVTDETENPDLLQSQKTLSCRCELGKLNVIRRNPPDSMASSRWYYQENLNTDYPSPSIQWRIWISWQFKLSQILGRSRLLGEWLQIVLHQIDLYRRSQAFLDNVSIRQIFNPIGKIWNVMGTVPVVFWIGKFLSRNINRRQTDFLKNIWLAQFITRQKADMPESKKCIFFRERNCRKLLEPGKEFCFSDLYASVETSYWLLMFWSWWSKHGRRGTFEYALQIEAWKKVLGMIGLGGG